MRQRTRRPVLTIWQGMSISAARKVRNSMVSSRSRCCSCCLPSVGEIGSSSAHQAFSVQASDGHRHVGPVGVEGVDRRVQGSDAAFEVADEVLLVAALVGFVDHLLSGEVPVVGDVPGKLRGEVPG